MAGSIDLPVLAQKYRLDTSSFNKGAKAAEDRAKSLATNTTSSLGGATSKIGGLFGKLDGLLGSFGLPFGGAVSSMEGKLKSAEGSVGGFGSKLASVGGVIAATAAAGLLAFGAIAVKEALDGEASHARLETAVHNAGEEYGRYSTRIEDVTRKMAGFGFVAPQVRDSLATLTGVTHDAGKALDLESLAADIARGRHIDLASATGILTKVETGHVALLGKLGIATKDSTGATISSEEALKRLAQLYGGEAQASANTFQGKMAALRATGLNFAETLGEKLIPLIQTFVSDGLGVVNWLTDANAATGGWLGKIALLAVGIPVAAFAVTRLVSGISAIVSVTAQAGAAIARMGVELVGMIAANPELAALVVTAGLGAVAFERWGAGTHFAKINVDALTNTQLVDYLTQTKNKLDQINGTPFAPKMKDNEAAQAGFTQALQQGIPQATRFLDAMTKAGVATDADRKALQDRIVAQKQTNVVQTEATAKADAAATATKAQIAATKALNTSLAAYGKEAGPVAEQVAASMKLSKDGIDALTASTKAMNAGIDKAFNDAGTVVDAWSKKSSFDLQKFEADLLTQTIATAQWSQNIAALSKAGIDKGFLQTLIDAGPKSAIVVKGLVDGVKLGSVQTINSIEQTGKTAAGAAKSTVDASLLGIRASFADFIAFVNNAHPNLDVKIAGQSATADQIHSLALAQHGQVGLKFDDGGLVPGPKGTPVAATVHGGEFVLSNAMLDAAARGTANGFATASGVSSSTASPEVVHREYHVHGPYAVKAEFDVHDAEALFRRQELLEPPG